MVPLLLCVDGVHLRVAAHYVIPGRCLPVDLDVTLIGVNIAAGGVVLLLLLLREERRSHNGRGYLAANRNLIVQVRSTGARSRARRRHVELKNRVRADAVDERSSLAGAEVREVAGEILRWNDGVGLRSCRGVVDHALEVGEEEQLVLNDGTANRGAKLVPLQNRAWQGGSDLRCRSRLTR